MLSAIQHDPAPLRQFMRSQKDHELFHLLVRYADCLAISSYQGQWSGQDMLGLHQHALCDGLIGMPCLRSLNAFAAASTEALIARTLIADNYFPATPTCTVARNLTSGILVLLGLTFTQHKRAIQHDAKP